MGDGEMYLKTQQLADALGVSPSSVKRWVDLGAIEAKKTMGNHRLVALSSALKFARARQYPTDLLIALSASPEILKVYQDVVDRLIEALRTGNSTEASALVMAAHQVNGDSVALADQLFRPVMERIGQLWMVGAWDVYQEHQAIQILTGSLVELTRKLARNVKAGRPLAMGRGA